MAGGAARDVSFSISEFKYHVCLSYSGSDTEKGFVSNLDAALKRAGLTTYKYEEIPDKRNDKKEILMQIARSLSIILIISENYASSPWYLDEMKWILECRLNSHILLLPVYYHQRRSIAKAFGKLVQGFGNDKLVKNWRYVLERVGKLGGWQYGERPESVLIPEIISILRGWLASTCRSRRGKPLSDLLVEILVNLASPGITDFLAKHVVLDRIKSLLITLGDKVKSIENKTFTNEEWSDHLENISQLLDKMTGCIDLGQEKGAEARVNVILKELEIMMEVAEPFLLEEKIFRQTFMLHPPFNILPPPWKYHVYLSFSGSDSEKGFASNLYAALQKARYITYKDEGILNRGETIQPATLRAIEKSFNVIVILSENYASSAWCLDELYKILQCHVNLHILPVYCGVDQSDVRNVSGSFGKAFARFVDNSAHDEDKVLRWMFAMRAVGNLSGLHSGGRSESVLIEEIVSKVRGQLIEMSRSRRGKSLSDFHFEILAKLVSPAITDFLAKCLELDNIKQSLVTLAGKVTGKNMKTFTPESSVEKWSDRLENVSYLLDKAIGHIYLGREKDAEAQVNNILKELETMMEYPDPFVHEQTIGKKKIIISFLQSYELRGSNNASVTVIVGSGKSRTFLADNVYRDATVMDSFDISGWVKFEDKLDALSLTKCILESLNANFCDGDDLQKLMAQLHECLSGWKSMLVFDGFDSFQNWEILVKCIEAAERGSSIVLTASKADIIEIGDCIVFTDQNVVSVSEAVHVDLNSSDLPDNEFVWKTLHRTSSHYLKKQPNMIVKEEVHEIAADELIEGLAYASEPQSLPTNANLATKSGDDSEADHQEASAVEIEDVVDDQTETSSDQDTLDFLSFVTINVSDVSQLRELPQRLHSLRIVECHFLESLAAELKSESLNLSELYMIDCGSLKDFVDESYCTSLTTLYINKCRKLEFPLTPMTTQNFACLKHLSIISSCDSLEFFTLNLFPKLKTLCIWDSPHLESLSTSNVFQNVKLKLESLELRDCPNLASFPAQGLPAPSLKSIRLCNCKNLKSLPSGMASLNSLQCIILERCPELETLPAGGLPSTLNLLSIAFCDKLTPQKEWALHRLHSLSRLEIESGCKGMESFPDKYLLPKNLTSLRISKLLSLTSLDYMGLQDLTSLESLEINSCQKLHSLSDEGFSSSLSFLCIKECPLLTQKLMYKAGAEWQKIARIPKIQVNDMLISSNSTRGSPISGNGII